MADYTAPGHLTGLTITGLDPGTYEVTVTAENEAGEGAASAAEQVLVVAGGGENRVIRYVDGETLETTIAGLDAGNYEVTVEADNVVGWGPEGQDTFTIVSGAVESEALVFAEIKLMTPDLSAEVGLPPEAGPLWQAIERITRVTEIGTGRGSLRIDLISSALAAADELVEDRAIRLRWDSESGVVSQRRYEFWRIESVDEEIAGSGAFVATCRPIIEDLADTVALYERGDGTVDTYAVLYDLEVNHALGRVFSRFGQAGNRDVDFIPVQTGDSVVGERVSLSGEALRHLDLLNMIADAAGGRLVLDHRSGSVWLSIEPVPDFENGTPAATIGVGQTFTLRRSSDASDLVTTLLPLGGPRGEGYTIGGLQWALSGVVSGTRIVLGGPGGSSGSIQPIWADGALVGSYLIEPDGTAHLVTDSAAPNIVEVAGASFGYADVGTRLRFASDAAGTELVKLSVPGLPAGAAQNEQVRRYSDVPPVPNLLESLSVDAEFGTLNGWSAFGGATIATVGGDPDRVEYGTSAVRVTAPATDAGIVSEWLALDDAREPYASAWLALERLAGVWTVEMVDRSGQVFGPADDDDAYINGSQEAYALSGMHVQTSNLIGTVEDGGGLEVRVRVRCVATASGPAGAAEIDLLAATVTQSAGYYEYRPGMGPHEVWQQAGRELARLTRAPRSEYVAEIADPKTLALLPPLEVEDVVALEYRTRGGSLASVQLPVVRIEEQLDRGQRSIFKNVQLGMPEIDGATAIGNALGIGARPGAGRWADPRALGSESYSPPRVRPDRLLAFSP